MSAQELLDEVPQLALFPAGRGRVERLNAALDQIADKFGRGAVVTADLVDSEPRSDEDDERRLIGASRVDAESAPPGGRRK